MITNWPIAFELLDESEGGLANKKWDNGGLTNFGVTQGTYNRWRAKMGRPGRSVRAIEAAEVSTIFHDEYWAEVRADELPAGLDYAMFDWAVNSGPAVAITHLQRLVGVKDDGAFGPVTMRAVRACAPNIRALIARLCTDRMTFLRQLEDWPVAGKGWTNRVNSVLSHALRLAA